MLAPPDPHDITVAYLVNLYPKVSHSFIRREILACEAQGLRVLRYAIRPVDEPLVDEQDLAEQERTRAILGVGFFGLLTALAWVKITRPFRYLRALWLAVRVGLGSDRGVLRHLIYLGEACVLLGWLEKENVDHLHAHFGTNSTTVAMLCHALGGPGYSFTAHGSAEFDRLDQVKITDKIERARFVVCVSDFGRSQLMRKCNQSHWSKIHVVHCGVDETLIDHDPSPPVESNRLVCVGRLCEPKGQTLLIDAARILRDEGVRFSLTLVGDGEMRPEVERAIEKYDLAELVTITGWASEAQVRAHLSSCRAMVLPSFTEGLPVVIMESFALGRPVIATCVGGVSELVTPGINGWLIPAGSVEPLVQAMREVLNTPLEELARMGCAGRKRVLESHDARLEAGKLIGLFQDSLGKGDQH